MPFYRMPPDKVREMYFSAVDDLNKATEEWQKTHSRARAYAIIEVVSEIYGSTVAGMLIQESDMRGMAKYGDVPMCGGELLTVHQ